MVDSIFKLSLFLHELDLPFDEALATTRELGAESVWFDTVEGETPIAEMSDKDAGRMAGHPRLTNRVPGERR